MSGKVAPGAMFSPADRRDDGAVAGLPLGRRCSLKEAG